MKSFSIPERIKLTTLTQTSFDERASGKFPIARRLINILAGTGTTLSSTPFSLNGKIKAILHNSEDITGADFNFQILDKDDVVVYTQNTITSDIRTYTNLTLDNIIALSGDEYTCKWTITNQTLVAADLQALLFLK